MAAILWTTLAVVLLLAEARITDDNELKNQTYQWKTGNWGSCYAPGGCGEGRRQRQVRCTDGDGRTVLQYLCEVQKTPTHSKSCFTACRHHKDKLQWQPGEWGPCLPVAAGGISSSSLDPDRESLGVKQRNVTCVLVAHDSNKVHRPVDEDNCFTVARKPDPVRFCRLPRPQDCVTSQFSEWSSCDHCGEGGHPTNQTRVRTVLVAPMFGGKPCPQLTEMRPCWPRPDCARRVDGGDQPEYKLKVGEWRRCEAPSAVVSADSLEAGVVTHIAGESAGPDLHSSRWDDAERRLTFQPQVGYRTREVSCRDARGTRVDVSLCLGESAGSVMPASTQPCVVPQDCVVSQWSAWALVQEGCVAANGKVRPEVHERKREVVRLQQGEGQPCPHLAEKRQVSDKDQLELCSHRYRRLASKWSPCVVTSDDPAGPRLLEVGCGGGVQLRDVTCVSVDGGQPVLEQLCESLEPLPTVQRCEVACPRDCEVGPWSSWGPCKPVDCPEYSDTMLPATSTHAASWTAVTGYRERRRSIQVMSSEEGVDCPSTKEVQPCPQPSCYSWVQGFWSSCYLDPGVKRCGEGRRTRLVTCRSTLYGNVVDESLCLRRQVKPPNEEPCLLPCPYDCVLSPWSDWSPCSHSCSSASQVALRQRNRTIVAPPGPGGHSCPDPDEMLQIEPCNAHSCQGYSWFTLPWQSCHVVADSNTTATSPVLPAGLDSDMDMSEAASSSEEDGAMYNSSVSTCGDGGQQREVWCLEDHDRRVSDWQCHPLPKPVTSRPCSRQCPVSCHMSPWSEWSPCPHQCLPEDSDEVRDRESVPKQYRRRVVIQWPASGGAACGPLEERRPCPLSAARCRRHTWAVGSWSSCQLPSSVKCGEGFRTRAVWCFRNQRSNKVEPSLCMEGNSSIPEQSQPCLVSCEYPCVVSQWARWSACDHACSARTRTRELIGLAATRRVCRNPDLFPLVESEPCPCDRYVLRPIGDWSDCILEHDIVAVSANGRPALGVCGSGARYRRHGCYNRDGALVDPRLCGRQSGLEEEPCLVPCPVDCVLSEWTAWGECSVLCGPGMQNRTRKVLRASASSGRPCEERIQHKVCHEPCHNFQWFAGGWSECQLIGADQNRGCGTGDQFRHVRCMQRRLHDLPLEKADKYCDRVVQPPDINACHVACPGECVLGPWSDWSECSQPCARSAERQRTRSVLRTPASSEATCPPQIEVQSCRLNLTCFTYSWHWTDYSSCLPLGGSPCGEGVQSRTVSCLRSDGRSVPDSLCEDQTRPAPTEKWCYVDCPVDCEVSQWTAWNSSECQCGSTGSAMTRRRYVVTNPSEKGRPCPTPLAQRKPCPAAPCYSWARGDWAACDLQGAWCGHGTVSRNVSCVRGAQRVEQRLCGPGADLRTSDSCFVPCRGDCQVSEWSRWSHCHRNCQGPDVGGYQTRSRAVLRPPADGGEPCPTALWETRPCFTGPCLVFDWALTEDGHITCQRSDGVMVVGGCDGKPKPCPLSCDAVDHSMCDPQAGLCTCAPGYLALGYDHRGHVTTCTPLAITDPALRHRVGHSATEFTAAPDEIQSRYYYPKDEDINVWMFAMIGIGCVFIVFVAVSIYLMCHSSAGGHGGQHEPMLSSRQNTKP